MKKEISTEELDHFSKAFREDRSNRVAQDAVMTNGLNKSCLNHEARRRSVGYDGKPGGKIRGSS